MAVEYTGSHGDASLESWHTYPVDGQPSHGLPAEEAVDNARTGVVNGAVEVEEDVEDIMETPPIEDSVPDGAPLVVEVERPYRAVPEEAKPAAPASWAERFKAEQQAAAKRREAASRLPAVREDSAVDTTADDKKDVVGELMKETDNDWDETLRLDMRLADWFSTLPVPQREGGVNGTALGIAHAACEYELHVDIKVERADQDASLSPEERLRAQMEEAAAHPEKIREMIPNVEPEEGSAWDTFVKAGEALKEFKANLPEPTLDQLLEHLKLSDVSDPATRTEACPEGESEVDRVLRLAAEQKNILGSFDKMVAAGRLPKTKGQLDKAQKVELKFLKQHVALRLKNGRLEDAFKLIAEYHGKQDERITGSNVAIERVGHGIQGEIVPQGQIDRQLMVMGWRYHTLMHLGKKEDAEKGLLQDMATYNGMRFKRREDINRTSPETSRAWHGGVRPEVYDPETIKDQAMLAMLTLETQMRQTQAGPADQTAGLQLIQGFLDGPVRAATQEAYARDPKMYLKGHIDPDVQLKAYQAAMEKAHLEYVMVMQANPSAGDKILDGQTAQIAEMLEGVKKSKDIEDKAVVTPQPGLGLILGELMLLDPKGWDEVEDKIDRMAANSGGVTGVEDPYLSQMRTEIQSLRAANNHNPELFKAMRAAQIREIGQQREAELLPPKNWLVVEGAQFSDEKRTGPLLTYIASHASRQDHLDVFDNGRPDWVPTAGLGLNVNKLDHMPNADAQRYDYVHLEGRVPDKTSENPPGILRQINHGGVCTVEAQHNPQLVSKLLQIVHVPGAPFAGEYVCRAFPGERLHFGVDRDGVKEVRRIPISPRYSGDMPYTLAIFRREEDGSENELMRRLPFLRGF